MEAQSRSVLAGPAEEAEGGDTLPSFEQFYEATSRNLFTALCLVTGNRQEAEEIAQDAFVRVFETMGPRADPGGSRPATCSASR